MSEASATPQRTYMSIAGEARDALNLLMTVGGADYTRLKIAEKLRALTPRFDWQEDDVYNFVRDNRCRFFETPILIHGKKANAVPRLNLQELSDIHSFAVSEARPLLEIISAQGQGVEVPVELRVSTFENELYFGFQHPAATKLALNRTFNFQAMKLLSRLIEHHLRQADPAVAQAAPAPAPAAAK